MLGECHAHVIMDGKNYRKAVDLHKNGVQEEVIRRCFQVYKDMNITFIRDGGDAAGVSERAKKIAPEYGIDYRTPVFAIHKEGEYGAIVGKGFRSMKEYYSLVLEAKERGADFIKIMTTGIMDFNKRGAVTGNPLPETEVREMIHIAHEEGMAVMSHTNGAEPVKYAVKAGVDSIEHGNFLDEEALDILSESETVWVPTLVPVRNLLGCGRFDDDGIRSIMDIAEKNIRSAYRKHVKVALGSDAGAYMVPHGQGLLDEQNAFFQILGKSPEVERWLAEGDKVIREKFRPGFLRQ